MLKNLLKRFLPADAPAPAAAAPTPAPIPARDAHVPAPIAAPDAVPTADALVAQGNDREDAGALPEAEALYRQAVAAAPGDPRGHLNLGIALMARDDLDGAATAFQRVLTIDPAHPFGNYNYARLAFLREDYARALELVDAALKAKPEFPQALVVRSNVLDALEQREPAIEAMQSALALQPDDAGGWFNLALMLQKAARPDEASAALEQSMQRVPDNLASLELSMRIRLVQGFSEEALTLLNTITRRDPTGWAHRSFELMVMNNVEDITPEQLYQRHLDFGRDMERAVPVRFDRWPARGEAGRRLRIGYVSRDLQLHPVAFFLAPVIERHDRTQVEVFCYSYGDSRDQMTERMRKAADHWRDCRLHSDDAFADVIHADGIDVLVDLVGHTGQPRLAIFCQRPAPVQVSWLGYLSTTGLTCIDYRLSDDRADPRAMAQPMHTERLVSLPASQWCYQPLHDVAVAEVPPFERNGHVTFGSFNATTKVSKAMCRRWAQMLMRVPGSRLLIGDVKSERRKSEVRAEFESLGVAGDRVEFLPRVAIDKYLDLYNRVDIALDTYPYGGGTTTLDALWMGAPVVAAMGGSSVSRSAASVLRFLGMDEWIANSIDGYVDLAVARANDPEGLRRQRRTLRERMAGSALTDVPRFTRDLESAYRAMWLERVR